MKRNVFPACIKLAGSKNLILIYSRINSIQTFLEILKIIKALVIGDENLMRGLQLS